MMRRLPTLAAAVLAAALLQIPFLSAQSTPQGPPAGCPARRWWRQSDTIVRRRCEIFPLRCRRSGGVAGPRSAARQTRPGKGPRLP